MQYKKTYMSSNCYVVKTNKKTKDKVLDIPVIRKLIPREGDLLIANHCYIRER